MIAPKLHGFLNPIYPRRIYVVKGNINEKWLNDRFFKASNDERLEISKDDYSAIVYNDIVGYREDGKYGILIYIKKKLEVKDIAHESVHAAATLFEDIGAYFDFDNQEPFTYLVGWIADCISQVNSGKFKD